MKATLSATQAAQILIEDTCARWTRAGAFALADYLEELEEDAGEEIEFDPVALRCDCTEYASLADFRDKYFADETQCRECIGALAGGEDEEELDELTREYIQDRGALIEFDGGIIVSAFRLSRLLSLVRAGVTAQGSQFAATYDPSAARLVAAAPELLAHLKILVDGISEGVAIPPDGAAVNAALEVIAKAERGGA